MKRRKFLFFGSIFALGTQIEAKKTTVFEENFTEVEATLGAVLEHLFPQGSCIPSAKEMHLTTFLFETMAHSSFDRDIKAFVLEGAKELEKREKHIFAKLNHEKKEKALRAYEKTNYGSNWIGRMMTLGMEGLFSDPIYGSNSQEKSWQSIKAYGASPRAKEKYLGV